ncbi:ribonuclease VapC [Candidatus Woesearchaeota archaeon CG10_big_fil_rev_8_21_14_0_10_30_7]|nr:MAG: ribonuclease VapC [Candidatus Woesearchaeota archaeon CG10_big_fil_rev_8_21_14_0_10_30_7]
MKQIVLDTNFLIYCIQNKIDFIEEIKRICNFKYELCIIEGTLQELDKLKEGRLAKAMINKFKIKKIKSEKNVDNTIIDLCGENVIVATHDKELISNLDCKIINVRQKKYLILK